MFLAIPHVLSDAELAAIREALDQPAAFASGKHSAGSHARAVKQNEQATASASMAILKKVENTLLDHPVFKAAASPKAVVKMMISRYQTGMHYGTHVDETVIAGQRTDLSFTLFLNEPDTYGGGELVIEENSGDRAFKLAAGSLILYPAASLHHVASITSGERLAVVGWVRSLIRSTANRETIFDIETIIATLHTAKADRAILDRLYKIRASLLRQWVDD